MKLVNFRVGEEVRLGIKIDQGIIDLTKSAAAYPMQVPMTIDEVINGGENGLLQLRKLSKKKVEILLEEQIVYESCVTNPEKIICIAFNYRTHTGESKFEIPTSPVLFSKFNNALAAHKEVIPLPNCTEKLDYEAELVIVIGKEAANVSKENALSYVFGYTVGNDLSARDLQLRTGQWLLGKTCDHFAPIGPYLVTADEVDPNNLEIQCKVNGYIRQSANTREMIFDCATIVSYISHHMTLKPGDIIFSGTPGGVIMAYPEDQQKWLRSGDEIIVSIEKIGSLVNVIG